MPSTVSRRYLLQSFASAAAASLWARTAFAAPVGWTGSPIAAPLKLERHAPAPPMTARHRALWSAENGAELYRAISGAARHGIEVSNALQVIRTARPGRAREAVLTRVALSYAQALSQGLCDPARVFQPYTIPRNHRELTGGLHRALQARALGPWLESLAPQDEEYAALCDAYLRERSRIGEVEAPEIAAGPTIRPGDADPRIPQIAARLGLAPETLAQGSPAEAAGGASTSGTASDPAAGAAGADLALHSPPPNAVLSPQLVQAVQQFQRANGIHADGAIGPETLAALNAGPQERARALALNLERRRWLVRQPPPDRIDVNLPAQSLVYFKDGEPAWTSRVAVGRIDDQTPDIQARFSTLTVNPPWHVPASIIRTEIRAKGPDYLEAQHMRWTRAGLVQAPGPWAALGLVKFDLQDPYDIYLHDTPAKGVFDDSERDLSHGCVRVQNAVEFARKLAGDFGDAERFDAALESGRTEVVPLARAITVRLLYHTASVGEAGQVVYRPDLYGRDEALADALGMARLGRPAAPPDADQAPGSPAAVAD